MGSANRPRSLGARSGQWLLCAALLHACGTPIRYLSDGPPPRSTESDPALLPLHELALYASLDQSGAEEVARAAARRWPEQFSGFEFRRVNRFSAGGQAFWMSIWFHPLSGLEFLLVPGGEFEMGSPELEREREEEELQNLVILDPFLIARTECTQDAYASVARTAAMNPQPSHYKGSGQLPVDSVSVENADLWCREAGLMLPTEAQWEYAARAGTTKAYSLGSTLSDQQACIERRAVEGSCPTLEVARYWPNAFGMHDVHGNVAEWCRDSYLPYDRRVEVGTGLRRGSSPYRVRRGGDFVSKPGQVRSASRSREQDTRPGEGFRPSLDLPR